MSRFIRQIYKSILPYETRLWLYKQRHLKDYKRLRTIVHHSPNGDFSLKPFDDHQCIFIHITKTAGTSVAQSLFGYLPYHYTACDYRVIYGRKTFNQYFKFAFVRNPWDRLYSAYRYLKAGGWNEKDRIWAESHLCQFESFNAFIKNWLTDKNINKHRHFWPQYRFICDAKGQPLINYLAYFETIDEDFREICNRLNIDATIGHHNANPGDNYRDVYDEETRNIVANIYSRDIQLFGYAFDSIKDRKDLSKSPSADRMEQI